MTLHSIHWTYIVDYFLTSTIVVSTWKNVFHRTTVTLTTTQPNLRKFIKALQRRMIGYLLPFQPDIGTLALCDSSLIFTKTVLKSYLLYGVLSPAKCNPLWFLPCFSLFCTPPSTDDYNPNIYNILVSSNSYFMFYYPYHVH